MSTNYSKYSNLSQHSSINKYGFNKLIKTKMMFQLIFIVYLIIKQLSRPSERSC